MVNFSQQSNDKTDNLIEGSNLLTKNHKNFETNLFVTDIYSSKKWIILKTYQRYLVEKRIFEIIKPLMNESNSLNYFKKHAQEIENYIFSQAKTNKEYYTLIDEEIFKIQKNLKHKII